MKYNEIQLGKKYFWVDLAADTVDLAVNSGICHQLTINTSGRVSAAIEKDKCVSILNSALVFEDAAAARAFYDANRGKRMQKKEILKEAADKADAIDAEIFGEAEFPTLAANYVAPEACAEPAPAE